MEFSMSLLSKFKPAPLIRPALNVGAGFDIPTGSYYTGKHGESILNGGLHLFTGIGARANMHKSTLLDFFELTVIDRYSKSLALDYDTEFSKSPTRKRMLTARMENYPDTDWVEQGRIMITSKGEYSGNAYWEELKGVCKSREEDKKNQMGSTPFIDKDGNKLKAFFPFINGIDSFSMLTTDAVEKIIEDNEVGDSGRNVIALRTNMGKNQLLMEVPDITARYGNYMILTAHVGDELQLDPYASPQKKLAFMKNKQKFKDVPEKFTFLPHDCYFIVALETLINQSTKAPEYPRNKDDDLKGDTDLMMATLVNLRGKSGLSGMAFPVILSQTEGILPGLTGLNYIKMFDYFGIGGNKQNYFLELCPDVALSRTTVRRKLDSDAKLRRAMEITFEMCQIRNLWNGYPEHLMCTPKELYDDLKAKGYDWDVLLNTRGYWVFEEDNHPLNFLSTQDLLKMRVGEYHPYWLKKENG
jgi:hypothetical protein